MAFEEFLIILAISDSVAGTNVSRITEGVCNKDSIGGQIISTVVTSRRASLSRIFKEMRQRMMHVIYTDMLAL